MDSQPRSIAGESLPEVEMLTSQATPAVASVGEVGIRKIEELMADLRNEMADLSEEMTRNLLEQAKINEGLQKSLPSDRPDSEGLVCSDFGAVHGVLIKSASINSSKWKTKCGWRLSTSEY